MNDTPTRPESNRSRPPRTPRDQMDPVKLAALERLEAADQALSADPKWLEAEELVQQSRDDFAELLVGVAEEERAKTALNAYRDADGRLRTRHGAFRAIGPDGP